MINELNYITRMLQIQLTAFEAEDVGRAWKGTNSKGLTFYIYVGYEDTDIAGVVEDICITVEDKDLWGTKRLYL